MPRHRFPEGHKYREIHGDAVNRNSPYNIWKRMKQRCYNPKLAAFKDYGGKGVKVCKAWHDYPTFRVWAIMHGWHKGLTLDRINSNGDYAPDNCQWVTKSINTWRRWHTV